MKTCIKCGESKPRGEYSAGKNACKACRSAEGAVWKRENPERARAASRRHSSDPAVRARVNRRNSLDRRGASRRGPWEPDELALLLATPSNKIVGGLLGRSPQSVKKKRYKLRKMGVLK